MTFPAPPLIFAGMRGMGKILVCLTVIVGMLFPALAGHAPHAAEAAEAHGQADHAHPDPHSPEPAGCEGKNCQEAASPDDCVPAVEHCVKTFTVPVRYRMQLRLSAEGRLGFHPDAAGPHRMPEMDPPPPRV